MVRLCQKLQQLTVVVFCNCHRFQHLSCDGVHLQLVVSDWMMELPGSPATRAVDCLFYMSVFLVTLIIITRAVVFAVSFSFIFS